MEYLLIIIVAGGAVHEIEFEDGNPQTECEVARDAVLEEAKFIEGSKVFTAICIERTDD